MKKIKYGALYKENEKLKNYLLRYYNSLNNQKYHLWIPIRVKTDEVDKTYMIDTYQAYPVYGDYEKQLAQLKMYGEAKDNSWYANQTYNYYYTAKVELNEHTMQAFDLFIDLDDYRVMKRDEEYDYKSEDVVKGIKLYHEHAYPSGLTLVRKDAKIDYEHKLDALFQKIIYEDLRPPYISNYSLPKINELSGKVKDTKKIDIVNKLNEKLIMLVKEYREYYNELIKGVEVKE
jgi:hypothetical protein